LHLFFAHSFTKYNNRQRKHINLDNDIQQKPEASSQFGHNLWHLSNGISEQSKIRKKQKKNLFVVARQKSNVEWNCISCECAILKQSRRRRLRFSLAVLQLESSFVCQRAKCQVAVRLHTHIRKHTRTLTHTTAAFCFGRVFVIACFYFWLFFLAFYVIVFANFWRGRDVICHKSS